MMGNNIWTLTKELDMDMQIACFLDVDPCLSLDSPFLDLSALEDFVSLLCSINPTIIY